MDEEVKKYTFDKNIVEVIVEKEDGLQQMENYIGQLMEHCLSFLK